MLPDSAALMALQPSSPSLFSLLGHEQAQSEAGQGKQTQHTLSWKGDMFLCLFSQMAKSNNP